jgi:hypothetical protein
MFQTGSKRSIAASDGQARKIQSPPRRNVCIWPFFPSIQSTTWPESLDTRFGGDWIELKEHLQDGARMFEDRVVGLQRTYDRNVRIIYGLCIAPTRPREKLHEILPMLDKICSTSSGLCVELSRTTGNSMLLREALRLDSNWHDLRTLVEETVLKWDGEDVFTQPLAIGRNV